MTYLWTDLANAILTGLICLGVGLIAFGLWPWPYPWDEDL